jgi:hypothetical protein
VSTVLHVLGSVVVVKAISEGAAHVRANSGVDRLGSADEVVLGVDIHLDLNVAVALDGQRSLGEVKVPSTTRDYERLLRWAKGFGPVGCAGIEGTSGYGALSSPAT